MERPVVGAGGGHGPGFTRTARIADIITAASKLSQLDPAVITGPRRVKHIMRVRQAVYLVARRAGHSFPQIGRAMDRDHSTVITGHGVASGFVARNPLYAGFVEQLEHQVMRQGPFLKPVKVDVPDKAALPQTVDRQTAYNQKLASTNNAFVNALNGAQAA